MTNDDQTTSEGRILTIDVRHQNRRTMKLRVKPDGDLVLFLPYWLELESEQVQKFVRSSIPKLYRYIPAEKPVPTHDADSIRALVHQWADHIGVLPKRIQIRTMTSKWGSCSYRGCITLNTALFYIPHHLVEYVIVHELVHLLVYNHSQEFWDTVGQFIPDYADREIELDNYRV